VATADDADSIATAANELTPSKPDIEMTRQVVAGLAAVDITVHDHIIVGRNRHTSFEASGLI
jgi:DNA repair protein RadC